MKKTLAFLLSTLALVSFGDVLGPDTELNDVPGTSTLKEMFEAGGGGGSVSTNDLIAATNKLDKAKRDKTDLTVYQMVKDIWTWTNDRSVAGAEKDAPEDFLTEANRPGAPILYFMGSESGGNWFGADQFWPNGNLKYDQGYGPGGPLATNLTFSFTAYDEDGLTQLYRFGVRAVRASATNETLVSWRDTFTRIATTDMVIDSIKKYGAEVRAIATEVVAPVASDVTNLSHSVTNLVTATNNLTSAVSDLESSKADNAAVSSAANALTNYADRVAAQLHSMISNGVHAIDADGNVWGFVTNKHTVVGWKVTDARTLYAPLPSIADQVGTILADKSQGVDNIDYKGQIPSGEYLTLRYVRQQADWGMVFGSGYTSTLIHGTEDDTGPFSFTISLRLATSSVNVYAYTLVKGEWEVGEDVTFGIISRLATTNDVQRVDLSGLVPYNGATKDVDLGGHGFAANSLDADEATLNRILVRFGVTMGGPLSASTFEVFDWNVFQRIIKSEDPDTDDEYEFLGDLLDGKADKDDIPDPYVPSATDPTFSNAVLSVGIDTNVLAAVSASATAAALINEFYSVFEDIGLTPAQGGVTLAGLLAAIVAALTWLKKQKANLTTVASNWESAETYGKNDLVTHGGALYRSKADENTGHTPSGGTSDSWWESVDVASAMPKSTALRATDDPDVWSLEPGSGDPWAGKAESTALAPAFDRSRSYSVGDPVTRLGHFYRCNTAIPTGGEEWTPGHWTEDTVSNIPMIRFDPETGEYYLMIDK